MKTATVGLLNLLGSGAKAAWIRNCVAIYLPPITRAPALTAPYILRLTDADVDVRVPQDNLNVYSKRGAQLRVSGAKQELGLTVSKIDIALTTVDQASTYAAPVVDPCITATTAEPWPRGISLTRAARNGALGDAQVVVWKAIYARAPVWGDLVPVNPNASAANRVMTFTPTGAVKWFVGFVTGAEIDSSVIRLEVKSGLVKLEGPFPVYTYQPGCVWTLFSSGCGLSRANFRRTGSMKIGSTRMRIDGAGPYDDMPDGYYDEGVLEVLSGPNAFVRRPIRGHHGGQLALACPLPYPPRAGDRIAVTPGCPKTYQVCGSRFNNQNRYRGFPLVPGPDAITGAVLRDVTEEKIRVPE